MSEPHARLLGVSDELVEFAERATLAALSQAMVAQCRRRLDIASRHLDPAVYDDDAFVEAVKQLVLGSRRARVRLFVIDSRPLLSRGHRLIDLAGRLSSFIELRGPAPQHKEFNEALLLADNQGYIHRQFSDRFEGKANFSDRRGVAALAERFDEMWERGTPDPNFRRLHI
ncbi:MAG: acyltransferase [Gammaproteobacteria bacterium]